MIYVTGSHITMDNGDYGIPIQFRITAGEVLPEDKLIFSIDKGGVEILHKDIQYADIENGAFALSFSEEESELLPPGRYKWAMTLIREDGTQRNTILGARTMEVVGRGA